MGYKTLLIIFLTLSCSLQGGEVIKYLFEDTDGSGNPLDQHIGIPGYLRGNASVGPVNSGDPVDPKDPTGSAAYFPSRDTNDYIEIAHDNRMLINEGRIDLRFMQHDDFYFIEGLVSKDSYGYDSGGHLSIYTTRSGGGSTGKVNVRLSSTSANYTISSGVLNVDTWYDMSFEFGSGGMKLYVDGVLQDTDAYTGGLATNYEPFILGALNTWSGDLVATPTTSALSGYISDFRVSDTTTAPEPSTYFMLGSMLLAVMWKKEKMLQEEKQKASA